MENLKRYQKLSIFALIACFGGVFGWIYEFIFYFFNYGCEKFYLQGGNFLPFINIYAIGAVLIVLLTEKFRKSSHGALKIFLISVLATGILEYATGWALLTFSGQRFWDYNTEILNFGNINGFICLRSVLFFGVSALFLIYLVLPLFIKLFIKLSEKLSKRALFILVFSLLTIFLIDEFYNLAAPHFNLPTANQVYTSLGFEYK